MVRVHVNKVQFEIAAQGLYSVPVESLPRGRALLKHYQRSAGNHHAVVQEYAATGKAVYQVEFENIAPRIRGKGIEVCAKVSTQHVEFGSAVFFQFRGWVAGSPRKLHCHSTPVDKRARRYTLFLEAISRRTWVSARPTA